MCEKVIKTKTAKIWLGKDGIVRIINRAGSQTDLKEAKMNVVATEKFGDRKRPTFMDISNIRSISKEARTYFSSNEASRRTKVMAMLIGSSVSRIIGNVYLDLDHPPYPVRLFTSKEKAFEWLRLFLD